MIRVALAATTALVLSGCAGGGHLAGVYEEPTLFSCGYLLGDTAQDICHVSVYRVAPEQRSAGLVQEVADAARIEHP